jgi:hypothetical protein
VRWAKLQTRVALGSFFNEANFPPNPFAYVINFSAPPVGTQSTHLLPNAGTVTLQGGTDGTGAKAAKATTLASAT